MSELQIPALEPFDCEGDPSTMRSRWERWKRALEIYFVATDTKDQNKKRALLLHCGGMALQDVYFNIPGAENLNATDVYEAAIKKLDGYFTPKQSYVLERYIFRLMKQEPNEKFEQFLFRLRRQCAKCNFAKEDENLIDQITEKCSSTKLRKNILLLGDMATIEKIIAEAKALEILERPLNQTHDRQSTKVTTTNPNTIVIKTMKQYTKKNIDLCSLRDSINHKIDSSSSPVINANCMKGALKGIIQKHCGTSPNKRKSDILSTNDNNNAKEPKVETSKNKEFASLIKSYYEERSNISHKKCAVVGCESNIGRMFEFPRRNKARLQEWILAAGDPLLLTLPTEKVVRRTICEKHFNVRHILQRRLCNTAVPTLFLPERISVPPTQENQDNTIQSHAHTLQDDTAVISKDENQSKNG